MTGLASVFPPPKFIPDPVVPVSCLAPLLAGALLLPLSLIRLLCASTPLPCPNAPDAAIKTTNAADNVAVYFMRLLKADLSGEDTLENSSLDRQIQVCAAIWKTSERRRQAINGHASAPTHAGCARPSRNPQTCCKSCARRRLLMDRERNTG